MIHELHYTSVPRGLRPGSVGFCTVAQTADLPSQLVERLESLSGYQQIFPPHDQRAVLNPVAYSHVRISLGGKTYSVLSRVCFAGLDYSARSNKYAHHVVLSVDERPLGGPAWLLSYPGFLDVRWNGEPRILPGGRALPMEDSPPGIARAWENQVGDAGWAGVLAEAFLADPRKPSYLLFEPGTDVLPLFTEALALIPPERRWEVELSTYFTQMLQGTACHWRGVLADSAEAKHAHRIPGSLVLDLRHSLGKARGGRLVELARTGRIPDFTSEPLALVPDLAPVAPPSHKGPEGPPAIQEFEVISSSAPPRIPPPRSVRELMGDDHDHTVRQPPWGKLTAGLIATLLLGLGIGYWRFGDSRALGPILAQHDREIEKSESKVGTPPDGQTPEQIAVADPNQNKPETGVANLPKDSGSSSKSKDEQLLPEPAANAVAAVVKAIPEVEVVKKHRAEPRVWFLELASIDDPSSLEKKETEITKIELPNEILPPYELLHQKVSSIAVEEQKEREDRNAELTQTIEEHPAILVIAIPSKSALVSSNLEVATFSFKGKTMSFCWNALVKNQPKFADIVRNGVIELGIKDVGIGHILLRDPKPRTERISLKDLHWGDSFLGDIVWADANSLHKCDWKLVITDWRIVSSLPNKQPIIFASTKAKEPDVSLALEYLDGEYEFKLLSMKKG